MLSSIGVRELRQNLSRYLERVKAGEALVVTERGREIARLVPSAAAGYAAVSAQFGSGVPAERLEVVARRDVRPGLPAGTTDAFLAESRAGGR